jgi:outer membrane protein OmpA-like peptidoglycan-associated protein
MKWWSIVVLMVLVSSLSVVTQAEDCVKATELVIQAFDAGRAGASWSEQKQLLQQALQLCPQHPEAHNNLATIFEQEQDYDQALAYYQEAVRIKPDFAEAWFGIGEVYYKTGKFALSLEAYLNACKDQDARQKIEDLLVSGQYRTSEAGEILDAQSLRLVFDPQRRAEINQKLRTCGFDIIRRGNSDFRAYVEPEVIFRNILFDVGKASLTPESIPQLEEIGQALLELSSTNIVISGHTDKQPFKGCSQEESDRKNMQLSQDRAATVAEYIVKLGVPLSHIETHGYGPTQPLIDSDTEEAYQQNRRVVIEVE